jgi:gliding motility-associated-like protein
LAIFEFNIMTKYLYTIVLLLFAGSMYAQNGCTVLGQTPSTAFPVCGTTILTQTVIPNCAGATIPVPVCNDPLGTYADVRPFWYKFTCFKGGTLGFLIQPNNNSDDYDWQIFDITGKNPSDVYTDASLFVSCNWSGITGPTGANATGSKQNSCAGTNYPNISSMPTLIQGHNYLMMVSNFSISQAGYKLSFGGGTSSITDTVTPKMLNATVACTGQSISLKLNKLMKCKSIDPDGSDFSISNSSVSITGATGVNCTTGFDMDSIVLTLNNPLPPGYAYITAKLGSDGNTILDNCDNGIAAGDTIGFVVTAGLPASMDSLSKAACAPKDITITLSDYVRCSSIAPDGSDFAISGPASISIVKASGNCNANGLTNTIVVSLTQSINTAGLFTISLKKGTDGNTIVNNCNKETPVGSLLTFTTIDTVSATFTYTIDSGCVNNTVHFKHNGNNGTNSWLWNFSNGSTSTLQNTDLVLPNAGSTTIKLTVSNGVCTNSYTSVLVQKFDTVKALFSTPASVCPTNSWSITNASTGNITSYHWDFGNGTTSTAQNPAPFAYALQTTKQVYNISLIVTNALGCKDTAMHAIEVKGNPSVVLDSVIKATCAPQSITVRLNNPVSCSSVAADGSDFAISGPSAISIKSASPTCDNTGLTNLITLNLMQPIKLGGNYTVSTKVGSDGNILLNDCGITVATGTSIGFTTADTVSAKFMFKIDSGCVTNTIHFTQSGFNNINQWNWNFGNAAAIATVQNPNIVVPNASTVNVQLIVSNGTCNDTAMQTIVQQFDTVKAMFDFPTPICPTSNWAIMNNSTGKIASYKWDFGNGTSSTLKNPLPFAYPTSTQQNQYAIRLIVANAIGCTDSLTKMVTVKANLPATLDSVVKIACKPQQLVLYFSGPIDCSSIAADGSDFNIIGTSPINIVSAAGNCNAAGLANSITVSFSQPVYTAGAFAIYLQKGTDGNVLINDCGVESLAGGNLTFTTSDTVNAQFTYNTTLGCNNDNIQFAHDGRHGVNQWNWTVSDGRTSTLQNPALVFPNAGNFTIQLTVSNGACSDMYSAPITLTFDTVQAIFEVPQYICPNEPWLISNTSTGKIVSFDWDFGSGVRSALQNPTNISYPIPTTVTQRKYTIRLTVTNNIGCSSTASNDVMVLKSCYIAVPTGFTPNNDGLNDYLGPLNAYKTENLLFKVFNRMGNVVFETTDWQKKWDGRINGILQPSGTYVWYLTYTDTDTKKVVNLSGTSVLIR